MAYVVRPMRLEDLDEVGRVERECYATPWPLSAYRREIRDNKSGRYVVLTTDEPPPPTETSGTPSESQGESGSDMATSLRRALDQLLRPLGFGAPPEPSDRNERIIGFAGLWMMLDEGHITTICVARCCRGRGLGEVLMSHLIDLSVELGASRVTLEVRVSNEPAKSLYRKYGFTEEGIRKRYYSDDNEDAAIMWSRPLSDPEYRSRLAELRAEAHARAGDVRVVTNA